MEDRNMYLVEHLDELRKRLIITLSTFITFLIFSFVFVQDIYKWLVDDIEMKLAILGPSDILWIYMVLACIVAFTGTIPVASHQIWLFIRPALNPKERKVTLGYIPALFFLFVIGLSFGYFVVFPLVFDFLLNLSGGMFTTFFTTEKYFRFLVHMTLPFGFLFEIPVIIMFLTSLGVLNPYRLQKMRKYAYFILIVISVLITPPDLISDVLVIIPLLLLYECSVSLSKIVHRRKSLSVHSKSLSNG